MLLTVVKGVGVGIGSNPAPGIKLVIVGAGANRERALASSGILPEGAKESVTQGWNTTQMLLFLRFYNYPCNLKM